ncbi:hypothetical protein F4774DRAFT_406725 [Daldinia eschscholtzii]|nr:hypothetical protein F4774DRAFT_406725 [Daldinia eschscholtzii]
MTPRGSSSRQKSCNGCVKSKRRCDQRLPACSNCAKKRRLCIYGRQSDTQLHSNPAGISTGLDSLNGSLPTSYGDSLVLDNSGARTAIGSDVDIPPDDTIQLDGTFESLLDSINGNEFSDMLGPPDFLRQDTQIVSIPRSKTLSHQDYSKMLAVCDDYAPWQLADPSTRIAYAMKTFKSFHVTIAQENSTMYMHRHLYVTDTPSWILQVFSVCVLYANQTEATRGLVLKVLHKNVQNLITTGNIVSLTPREKLARVHALIAYQTIRMLDGDVSLGQQADNDVTLLEAWNGELCKMRDNLEDMAELDATEIRNKPPESWERWLFAESVRRTYMICAALIHFWGLLKGRRIASNLGDWQYVHRWTLSRHLWTAMDPLDFHRAWKEKPMWIISALHFDDFLRTGKGDDIDDFALAFLTLSFGVNEMKTFWYETSGRLLD